MNSDEELSLAKFGCVTICIVWIGGCYGYKALKPWLSERREQKAAEIERRELERKARDAEIKIKAAQEAKEQKEANKKNRIQKFAEKEAPQIWKTLEELKVELEMQEIGLERLRKTFEEFDRKPEVDVDYQRMCEMKSALSNTISIINGKLEDAYIAAEKFRAAPGAKEYSELQNRAICDGIEEAESAIRRFDEMRKHK